MPRQMKDSGVYYIREIPDNWSVSKYKFYSKSRMGLTILKTDTIDDGVPIYSATQDEDIFGYINNPELVLHKGDFVIPARGNSIGCVTIVKEEIATCTQTTICSTDISGINPKYLYYCCIGMKQEWFKYEGSAIPQVTVSQLENNSLPLPPQVEQERIVFFLDSKCAHIDSIIEKTKESIEEYKKLKQAIITEAVNVEGDYCKISHLGELKNGLNFNDSSDSSDVRFLGVADFKNHFIMDEFDMFSEFHSDEVPEEYLLQSGDIVFVRSNGSKELVGRSVMVDNIDYRLTYGGFCIRFRNNRNDLVLSKYLLYFFRSQLFRENIKKMCFSTNINNLSQDMIKSVRISLPSLAVQEEIVHALDKKCKDIDLLVDYKEQTIYELDVYKKSLIYEYVTGKKEVPAS